MGAQKLGLCAIANATDIARSAPLIRISVPTRNQRSCYMTTESALSIDDARALAASYVEAAINTLGELMETAKSASVRLAAARDLIKLAWGKVKPPASAAADAPATGSAASVGRAPADAPLAPLNRHQRRALAATLGR